MVQLFRWDMALFQPLLLGIPQIQIFKGFLIISSFHTLHKPIAEVNLPQVRKAGAYTSHLSYTQVEHRNQQKNNHNGCNPAVTYFLKALGCGLFFMFGLHHNLRLCELLDGCVLLSTGLALPQMLLHRFSGGLATQIVLVQRQQILHNVT